MQAVACINAHKGAKRGLEGKGDLFAFKRAARLIYKRRFLTQSFSHMCVWRKKVLNPRYKYVSVLNRDRLCGYPRIDHSGRVCGGVLVYKRYHGKRSKTGHTVDQPTMWCGIFRVGH